MLLHARRKPLPPHSTQQNEGLFISDEPRLSRQVAEPSDKIYMEPMFRPSTQKTNHHLNVGSSDVVKLSQI